MYNIGELIIYGSEGVCRVDEIGAPQNPSASRDRLYYTLTPLYRNGRVITPVDTATYTRPVISSDEAEEIIQQIPEVQAEAYINRNLKELADHYKDAIQTYDCTDMVRTIKAIRLKRRHAVTNGKKLGSIDERFLKRAEDMLYGELAAALEVSKDEVATKITDELTRCDEQEHAV